LSAGKSVRTLIDATSDANTNIFRGSVDDPTCQPAFKAEVAQRSSASLQS
jgi:hypothetical protein